MEKFRILILLALLFTSASAFAQRKEKMQFEWIGPFEGPVKSSSIYKFIDRKERVICYVMHPDSIAGQLAIGGQQYDANSVGSISCVYISPEASETFRDAKRR